MSENAPVAPWYRQPWFWFLTIAPIATIIYGIFFIIVASSIDDSMVSDSYSKDGRAINMAIARDQRAQDMEIAGMLDFRGRDAELSLETKEGPADFPYLVLHLYHPTLSDKDRTIQFQKLANGEYSGQIHGNLDGRWYYDLKGPTNEWRVKGELYLPSRDAIAIKAQDTAKE
ncbi:MAG: hypothetical protein AWU57_2085 [Marinobacter sp. T13-3]|nr:MAG: hypothetical protein AWU57_2085 [Marinobacter sp. T13-3]